MISIQVMTKLRQNRYITLFYYLLTTRKIFMAPIIILFRFLLVPKETKRINTNQLQGFHHVDLSNNNKRIRLKLKEIRKSEDIKEPVLCYKVDGIRRIVVFDGNGRLTISRIRGFEDINCLMHGSKIKWLTDILCYSIIRSRYIFGG